MSRCCPLSRWAQKYRDDKTAYLVEKLAQTNPLVDDMVFAECNDGAGHEVSFHNDGSRSLARPGGSRGRFGTGKIERDSDVDRALMAASKSLPEATKFRENEDMAVLDAMSFEMQRQVFYGNMVEKPDEFMGFSQFYNTLDPALAQNAVNVIDAGGAGDANMSIWLAAWSPETAFGIFPEGSKAGLLHLDRGEMDLFDADGHKYRGYRSFFKWDCGICLPDWRCIVRIANVPISEAGVPVEMPALMDRAIELLPRRTLRKRPIFYMNRPARFYLDVQALAKAEEKKFLEIVEVEGVPQDAFRGFPIHVVDALGVDERRVT